MLATETSTIASNTLASSSGTIASSSSNIASAPVLPPGEEIYDILDSVSMSYPWLELLGKIFLTVISIYLLYLFYAWLTAPFEKKRKPIIQTPDTQALRAIKRKLSSIWQERNLKSICENVAAILKNYTFDKYKLSFGAAATTDEFIPSLIDGKIRNDILFRIEELLKYCDEIRYTGNTEISINQEYLIDTLEDLINMKEWVK